MWGIWQAFFYVAVVVILLAGLCLLIDLIVKKKNLDQAYREEIAKTREDEDYEDLDDIITE